MSNSQWYPSKWGPDDVLGAMNLLTPSRRLEALSIIKQGITYELGHVLHQGMPVPEFHGQYFANTQYTLENGVDWHHKNFAKVENGYSAQNLRLSMSDQSGTHIDQLNHVGWKQPDGRYFLYNGTPNQDVIDSFGTTRLGIETMPPLISRGILIDIAALHGVDMLPKGYAISPEELDRALESTGTEVKVGDTVFVRTGWGTLWSDPSAYLDGEPGLGKACAEWALDHEIVCWGLDQHSIDPVPFETPGEALPVHIEMLIKNGVRLMENVYLEEVATAGVTEFCLIALPLKLKGGTGSPLRPIALV